MSEPRTIHDYLMSREGWKRIGAAAPEAAYSFLDLLAPISAEDTKEATTRWGQGSEALKAGRYGDAGMSYLNGLGSLGLALAGTAGHVAKGATKLVRGVFDDSYQLHEALKGLGAGDEARIAAGYTTPGYHYTDKQFYSFDPFRGDFGTHFGSRPEAAADRHDMRSKFSPSYKLYGEAAGPGFSFDPLEGISDANRGSLSLSDRGTIGGRTYPMWLRLDNPIEAADGSWDYAPAVWDKFQDVLKKQNVSRWKIEDMADNSPEAFETIAQGLKRGGFDSVKYINDFEDAGTPSYIILDPWQAYPMLRKFDARYPYSGSIFGD